MTQISGKISIHPCTPWIRKRPTQGSHFKSWKRKELQPHHTTPLHHTTPHHRDNRSSDVCIIRLPAHTVSAEINAQNNVSPPTQDMLIDGTVRVCPNDKQNVTREQDYLRIPKTLRQHSPEQRVGESGVSIKSCNMVQCNPWCRMTQTATTNWHNNTWPFLPDNLQSSWSNAHLRIEIAHNLNRRIKNSVEQQDTTLQQPSNARGANSFRNPCDLLQWTPNEQKKRLVSTTTRKIDWSSQKVPNTLELTKCGEIEKMPNEITQHTCWYEWPTTLFGNIWIHPHQRLICRNTHTLTTLPTSLTRCVDLPSSCAHCFCRNSIAEQRNGSPILHIFITRNVPHLCLPQKTSTTTRKIVSASPQRSDSVLLEKWSRIEFVNQLASLTSTTFMWTRTNRMKHLPSHDQNLRKNRLPFATHEFVPMPLFTFGITHNFWPRNKNKLPPHRLNHSSNVPIMRLATPTVAAELRPQKNMLLVRITPRYTMTLWSKTSVAEFQSPNQPTNFAWIKCFVHVDNSAENKTKTPTHKPKSAAKLKFELQANRISPPTLHILITGTIHHVCAKRTPREYSWHNDNTDDCEQFPLTNTITQKNWHYRNKNKRCTTTLHHNHTARTVHQLWLSSTFQRTRFQQQLTDTGHPRQREPYTMSVPEGHNGASWLTTMQMTTAHKSGIMHCNCQHETTERKCRNTPPPQHRVAARMCPWPVFWHTKFLLKFSKTTCRL